jgi:hypothetical protein
VSIVIMISVLVISTAGPQNGPKWSASSPLGMKVFFTLSGAEGLDSASLHSPLGTPGDGWQPQAWSTAWRGFKLVDGRKSAIVTSLPLLKNAFEYRHVILSFEI